MNGDSVIADKFANQTLSTHSKFYVLFEVVSNNEPIHVIALFKKEKDVKEDSKPEDAKVGSNKEVNYSGAPFSPSRKMCEGGPPV